ncbi:bifunctional acetate--CoA ligase family protein/GNAT family N-acetyltransferase [Streptomyces sp. 4N509B]|uniref:bifunctional acetate--CoA ligase family protein/GNAT family N-acetyltransferase n=1 Tax=Streptomyces sp. 4N509B TaxID=3457413 RepID=UPI003FD5C032
MVDAEQRARGVHALLTDGSTVLIRPVEPSDHDEVLRLYEGMTPQHVRARFFSAGAHMGRQAADRMCGPPAPGYRALAALVAARVVGVAEYRRVEPESTTTAELALAVAEGWHHRGVGTLLLEHLVDAAREEGITAFTADALADNHPVLEVFAHLGLPVSRRFSDGEVHCAVRLDTDDEHYLRAVDERARGADAASLRFVLRPACVAVVGAGRRAGSVGREVLRNIRRSRYTGLLYAVNPNAHSIAAVPCFPSVTALPHTPDLAVVAVPPDAVPGVARECGATGVRGLVVLTSGLDRGQGTALLEACRAHGMRLVGPNCLGVANTHEEVRLEATFAPPWDHGSGTAGVAVQSGGVGIALLRGLAGLGIGTSSFVSLGDKYDVSGNDLLRWWESDERTTMALLHLESYGNPRAFSRTARRVARRMPVLTVDAGRSEAGRRGAASHTAAAATPTMSRQALFTQAGIIATRSINELLCTAALLHAQPLPAGTSVAVVSNAGGMGVLVADACVEAGLAVPPFPADLTTALGGRLPAGSGTANPVDVTPAVTEEQVTWCVDLLAGHPAVDAVVVALVPTAVSTARGEDLARALTDAGEGTAPVAAVLFDQVESVRLLPAPHGRAVPAYADPASAAHALAHAAGRARWRARPVGTVPELDGIDRASAGALVDAFLAQNPGGGWLDPTGCAGLLDAYGIPQVPWAWVTGEDEAAEAAARLAGPGGRAVLKAYGPGLVHKSERGGVLLDLAGEEAVRASHRELVARFGDAMAGVLVQAMAERGTELIAGVVQDEVFGPLVLFGLGGTATNVLADHAARLAPLTDRDAHDLITAPRCAPLLLGHHGAPPADLAGLESLLLRLSRLASDLPQLAEADLNPVVARPDGVTVLDTRVRLLPRRAHDPYLRRLR